MFMEYFHFKLAILLFETSCSYSNLIKLPPIAAQRGAGSEAPVDGATSQTQLRFGQQLDANYETAQTSTLLPLLRILLLCPRCTDRSLCAAQPGCAYAHTVPFAHTAHSSLVES